MINKTDKSFTLKGKIEAIEFDNNDKYHKYQIVYNATDKKLYHIINVRPDKTADAIVYDSTSCTKPTSNYKNKPTIVLDPTLKTCYRIVMISKRIINNEDKFYIWSVKPTTIQKLIDRGMVGDDKIYDFSLYCTGNLKFAKVIHSDDTVIKTVNIY